MTENNSTTDVTTTKVVVSDDGSFFPAMSSYLVDITPDEAADPYARLAAARGRGSRVFALESRINGAVERREAMRTAVQEVIDGIRETIKEGNSFRICDWVELMQLFGDVPDVEAGPPVRYFSGSVTITATVDFSGHAPKEMKEHEVADRIRNMLSLIHEFDLVDDTGDEELFVVEQDSSSIDLDAEQISIRLTSI